MKRIGSQSGQNAKGKNNDVLNNMNNNFARETNQRDEDAEMQKFIEEQLRIKKGESLQQQQQTLNDEKK